MTKTEKEVITETEKKGNDEEKKAISKIFYPTLPFIYLSWFIFRQSP